MQCFLCICANKESHLVRPSQPFSIAKDATKSIDTHLADLLCTFLWRIQRIWELRGAEQVRGYARLTVPQGYLFWAVNQRGDDENEAPLLASEEEGICFGSAYNKHQRALGSVPGLGGRVGSHRACCAGAQPC